MSTDRPSRLNSVATTLPTGTPAIITSAAGFNPATVGIVMCSL